MKLTTQISVEIKSGGAIPPLSHLSSRRGAQLINFYFLYPFLYTALLRCRGFHFSLDLYTIGRTSSTSDGPVARPLPKYRTTQTE
jgi:hypothetical protein